VNLPKAIAFCALATLLGGASLLATGIAESTRQATAKQSGLTKIPHDSELVRSLLDAHLDDRTEALERTLWLLAAADRAADAENLNRFFVDCNLRRLLAEDDACRRETVRSAIARGAALPERDGALSIPRDVEAELAQELSLSWPDEALLRASAGEQNWPRLRYDGAGVLRYSDPDGAYVFVAARNLGPWGISSWRIRLILQRSDAKPLQLECDSNNPFPFHDGSLAIGAQGAAHCNVLGSEPVEQVIGALRDAGDAPFPQATFAQLALRDPYVRVTDVGAARFKVEPMDRLPIGSLTRSIAGLPHELAALDCNRLASCPSLFASAAVRFAAFFDARLKLVPALLGALLGLAIGGLARRSLTIGGAFAGVFVLLAIVGIALLFGMVSQGSGEKGFPLLGIAMLIYGAGVGFGLGLPAFFIALLLMKTVRARSAQAVGPTEQPAT
jgi:hypothetical protein